MKKKTEHLTMNKVMIFLHCSMFWKGLGHFLSKIRISFGHEFEIICHWDNKIQLRELSYRNMLSNNTHSLFNFQINVKI